MRARADRSRSEAVAVGSLDELDGDEERDCERELGESLVDEPVGVAA